MGLDVLGESGPGEGEVVSHKVINWVSGHEGCSIPSVSPDGRYMLRKLTQGVG
jgi:hypothetical protein